MAGRRVPRAWIDELTDNDQDVRALQRMQSGDSSGVAELYDRYAGLMLGVALRILRNRVDAEEAVQEAWVYAWRRARTFDSQRASVPTWLVMIARSRALDHYRSVTSRRRAEEQAPPPPRVAPDDPSRSVAQIELQQGIVDALEGLEPQQRRAIETAFFEGLSHAQVAERLGKPLGTVKYWIREGLKQLGERLPKEDWS